MEQLLQSYLKGYISLHSLFPSAQPECPKQRSHWNKAQDDGTAVAAFVAYVLSFVREQAVDPSCRKLTGSSCNSVLHNADAISRDRNAAPVTPKTPALRSTPPSCNSDLGLSSKQLFPPLGSDSTSRPPSKLVRCCRKRQRKAALAVCFAAGKGEASLCMQAEHSASSSRKKQGARHKLAPTPVATLSRDPHFFSSPAAIHIRGGTVTLIHTVSQPPKAST